MKHSQNQLFPAPCKLVLTNLYKHNLFLFCVSAKYSVQSSVYFHEHDVASLLFMFAS